MAVISAQLTLAATFAHVAASSCLPAAALNWVQKKLCLVKFGSVKLG
jgi:hypothetical protein